MKRYVTRYVLFVVVLAASQSAHAQSNDRTIASERFKKGVELYQNGDVRAALIEFKRAYELMPTYQLLYNMGQAATELNDYVDAYSYYRQYLKDGGKKVSAQRKQEVFGQIQKVKGYIATLTLTIQQEGAEVSIDGRVVGVSPLSKALVLSAGRRVVVVTKAGYSRWERRIDLAGSDDIRLDITLLDAQPTSTQSLVPVAAVEVAPMEKSEGQREGMGSGFWVATGFTTFLALGTGYSAYRTIKRQDEYERQLERVPNSKESIKKSADKLKEQALFTDIGLGLTVTGAVVSILFATLGSSSSSKEPKVSIGWNVRPGQSSIGLQGHF